MSLCDTPKHEKTPKFRRGPGACRNIGVFSEQVRGSSPMVNEKLDEKSGLASMLFT
jgi:hypothetical protein